jgi:hypothetical protein
MRESGCQPMDLRRSVNYLETRNDLNHEKFSFFAISLSCRFATPTKHENELQPG